MLRTLVVLAGAAHLLAACTASMDSRTALMPGMTRDQVTQVMGPPKSFTSGAGGAECLSYEVQTGLHVSAHQPRQVHVVTLVNGKVVKSETQSPLASWGASGMPGTAPAPVCSAT